MSTGRDTAVEGSYSAWLERYGDAAAMEGWSLFECFGSENGDWQLQRLDDASDVPGGPQLAGDDDAWRVVLQGTGDHHAAALGFLMEHNPKEYEALLTFQKKLGVELKQPLTER